MGRQRKQQKPLTFKIIFVIGLCIIAIAELLLYENRLRKELNAQMKATLKEVAAQSAQTLYKEILWENNLFSEIAQVVSEMGGADSKEALHKLRQVTQRYGLKRMGIIMPDGTAYTTDGVEMNLADRDYFKESMNGMPAVSDIIKDKIGGSAIVVFSTPVYKDGHVTGVLFATYAQDEFRKILAESTTFEGQGYLYVVRKNGDAVAASQHNTNFYDGDNIFDKLTDVDDANAEASETLKAGMDKEESGYIHYINGVSKYMYYMPLGINDWYMLSIVPASAIDEEMGVIMRMTSMLFVVFAAVLLFFVVYIAHDERRKNKQLEQVLYVDKVTGGYSYEKFCLTAQKYLRDYDAKSGRIPAFIAMDIDKFKLVNEIYGFEKGNQALCYIRSVWVKNLRAGECVGRRIADHFVALLFVSSREELLERMNALCRNLIENAEDICQKYILKPTVGIYMIEDRKEDLQSIQNCAVMANSRIKGRHDVFCAFYDESMRKQMMDNKLLEDQMESGFKNHEFTLWYQPKIDTKTKAVCGAEALIRWIAADGTVILPSKFIPLAENNGFIAILDLNSFELVCRTIREWLDLGLEPVPVSVNLSRQVLYHREFIEEYRAILEKYKVPVRYVQIEITESALFENQAAFAEIIEKLRQIGFKILMDDFGTGYSSMMMLKSVNVDVMKMDKSFIDDYKDDRGRKILISVIELAKALDISMTAEGVENKEQYIFLKDMGCDSIQGYYFYKPMPEEQFRALLKKSGPAIQ